MKRRFGRGFIMFTTTKKNNFQRSLLMRIEKHTFHKKIKSNLHIEFAEQSLTSYSGLELFNRYFRSMKLKTLIRKSFGKIKLKGDFSMEGLITSFIALYLTGGRRLRHFSYIAEDPLVQRVCATEKLPSDKSYSRYLKQFTNSSLEPLKNINKELTITKIKELSLPRVTLDFDGTVLSCGDQVAWAARGYNPHNRHSKSYYPILCHVAQTGHFLIGKNRPGNRHDSKGGAFKIIKEGLKESIKNFPKSSIEARFDSAFFTEEIVKYLGCEKVEFALKVPMWQYIGVKEVINQRKTWYQSKDPSLSYFKHTVHIKKWKLNVDLIVYRKKISTNGKKKTFQLDLFSPDDGIYEYFLIHSNKNTKPETILDFYNGRCNMEHQIAELKNEFGFDCVPTNHYQANSAYQQISLLAYNLTRNFQIDMCLTQVRKKSASRTNVLSFKSLKTIRFELIAVAGRILNLSKGKTLRIAHSFSRRQHYEEILDHLAAQAA